MGSWGACRSNIHSRLRGLPYASSEQAFQKMGCVDFFYEGVVGNNPQKIQTRQPDF